MKNQTSSVNFVFQSPGGIGKTLVASWVAEFFAERDLPFIAYDADPSRKVLAQIPTIAAKPINLVYRDSSGQTKLNTAEMDETFSSFLEGTDSVIVDCGGAGYERVSSYLLANNLIEVLAEERRVLIHIIVVGGRDHAATVKECAHIIQAYPDTVEKVVWINPHFGPVEYNGTPFLESAFMQDNADKVSGIINMPELQHDYTSDYFKTMVANKLTFSDIAKSIDWNAIAKLRMKNIWKPIASGISEVM